VENLIGAAPLWMMRAWASVAVGAVLIRLSGFHRPAHAGRVQALWQRGDMATSSSRVTQSRLSAGNERLEALLAQAAPELAAGLREEMEAREQRHNAQDGAGTMIASAPASTTGACGLAMMLLCGHGHKPAPRLAAGWAALTDSSTPQSTWVEARDALGLTQRQAISVAVAKLSLWHWSQPVRRLPLC
jgi:hypothetical protein